MQFFVILFFEKKKSEGFTFNVKKGLILLDNAATTLPTREILNTMRDFSGYYANIHRGTGMSSLLSTHCYERSKEVVKEFVSALPMENYFVTYGKNVTESLNLVCAIIGQLYTNRIRTRNVILLSEMEHTSNDIPFRFLSRLGMKIDYIGLNGCDLDYNDFQSKVNKYGSDLNLISVTGVSNVTGVRTNIPLISGLGHSVGSWICIDGAQLIPHTRVDMASLNIDFLGFSAHKIYCPFGLGVLISRIEILKMLVEPPLLRGGGTIAFNIQVSPENNEEKNQSDNISIRNQNSSLNVIWKKNDELLDSGTASIIPCVALVHTLKSLQRIGMDKIELYEAQLYSLAYSLFSTLPINIVSPPPSSKIKLYFIIFYAGVKFRSYWDNSLF